MGSPILNWDIDEAEVCDRVRSRTAPFKIVMKTKDERHFLTSWIDHHAKIVGRENLIIFDNGSSDPDVIDTLNEAANTATVVSFSGYHNVVHRSEAFHGFYKALACSTEFFMLLDTDELLVWADDATQLAPESEIVQRLCAADLGRPRVVTGLWLDNALGSKERFWLYNGAESWPAGITTGKPILSAKAPLPKMIGHNFQLDLDYPEDVSCGRAMVLHLKNLIPQQRIAANIRKLRQYKVIDFGLSEDEALKSVLSIDIDKLDGNPKQWLKEIRALHHESSSVDGTGPLKKGEIAISGGCIRHGSDAQRAEFEQYLLDPGWFLAHSLAKRSRPSGSAPSHISGIRPLRRLEDHSVEVDSMSNSEQAVAGEITISHKPSMDDEGLAFFRSILQESQCYLEYGSGGSTRLAAHLGVPKIYSVESDPAFAKAVRRAVSWNCKKSEFKLIVPDIGKTGAYGYPKETEKCANWWRYATQAWDVIATDEAWPDLILIDGRFRVICFLTALIRAKPGARILFDDYANRLDRYGEVETILKPQAVYGRLAEFVAPADLDFRKVADKMLQYSCDPR